jgi:hypothetical protein
MVHQYDLQSTVPVTESLLFRCWLEGYVSLEGGKESSFVPFFPVHACSVAGTVVSCMRPRVR